jgi:hypothetical protein
VISLSDVTPNYFIIIGLNEMEVYKFYLKQPCRTTKDMAKIV